MSLPEIKALTDTFAKVDPDKGTSLSTAKKEVDAICEDAALLTTLGEPFKKGNDLLAFTRRYALAIAAAGIAKDGTTRLALLRRRLDPDVHKDLSERAANVESDKGKAIRDLLTQATDVGLLHALSNAYYEAQPTVAKVISDIALLTSSGDFASDAAVATRLATELKARVGKLDARDLAYQLVVDLVKPEIRTAYLHATEVDARGMASLSKFVERATDDATRAKEAKERAAKVKAEAPSTPKKGKDREPKSGPVSPKTPSAKRTPGAKGLRPCRHCNSDHYDDDTPTAPSPAPATAPRQAAPTPTVVTRSAAARTQPPASGAAPQGALVAEQLESDEEESPSPALAAADPTAVDEDALLDSVFAPAHSVPGQVAGAGPDAKRVTIHIASDSGAEAAFVNRKLVDALGIPTYEDAQPAVFFDVNAKQFYLRTKANVEVTFLRQTYQISAYVSEQHPYLLCIGRQDMHRHGMLFDHTRNVLKLRRENNARLALFSRVPGHRLPPAAPAMVAQIMEHAPTAFARAAAPHERKQDILVLPKELQELQDGTAMDEMVPRLRALARKAEAARERRARPAPIAAAAQPALSAVETLADTAVTADALLGTVYEGLAEGDRQRILASLLKFPHLWIGPGQRLQLGQARDVEHTMPMPPEVEARPPTLKLGGQALSPLDAALVSAWVEEGLATGRIEVTDHATFVSRLVFVRKFDEVLRELKTRICMDLRVPNKYLLRLPYPQKHSYAVLERLRGARLLGKIDLKSAYEQLSLAERDRGKTAFYFRGRLYQHRTMVFGDANAPFTMQAYIERVLVHCHDFADALLDDILIHVPEHDVGAFCTALEEVLQALSDYNLRVNLTKCKFGYPRIDALGHLVSGSEVAIPDSRVAKILALPRPTDRSTLASHIAALNFYRRFILGFAHLTAPLTDLLSPKADFVWLDTHERAWRDLLAAYARAPILAQPLPDLPYVLRTDASQLAAGFVLFQLQDGVWRLVGAGSQKFKPAQTRYSATSRELYALVAGLKHFRYLIQGARDLLVETDHQALRSIVTGDELANSRIANGISYIQEYGPFKVVYRRGRSPEMALPDALSRAVYSDPSITTTAEALLRPDAIIPEAAPAEPRMDEEHNAALLATEAVKVGLREGQASVLRAASEEVAVDRDRLRREQATDPVVQELSAAHLGGPLPTSAEAKNVWRLYATSLTIEDGLLQVRTRGRALGEPRLLPYVPLALREAVLLEHHDAVDAGHYQDSKLTARVFSRLWWPTLEKDARRHAETCLACAQVNPARPRATGALQARRPGRPNEELDIDYMVLPESERGNTAALISVDRFSGYVRVAPTATQSAEATLDTMARWLNEDDAPEGVLADNAKVFVGQALEDLVKLAGSALRHSPVLHPQSNPAERQVQNVKAILRKALHLHPRLWCRLIYFAARAINTTPQEALGWLTPHEVHFGRRAVLPSDLALGIQPPAAASTAEHAATAAAFSLATRTVAAAARAAAAAKIQKQLDARAVPSSLRVGDNAMLERADNQIAHTLDQRYDGPFPVTAMVPPNEAVVELPSGAYTAHVSRLKLYKGPLPLAPIPVQTDHMVELDPPANLTVTSLVGRRVRVYWAKFRDWFDGTVVGRDKRRSLVRYDDLEDEYGERLIGYSHPPPWKLLEPGTAPPRGGGGG